MIPSTSSHPPSKVPPNPACTATGTSYTSRPSPSISSSSGLQYHRQSRRIYRVANTSSSLTRPTISSTGKQRSIPRSTSSTSLVSLSAALLTPVPPPQSPVTRRHRTKEIPKNRRRDEMSILYGQLATALKAQVKVVFDQDGTVDLIGGANTGSSYSLPGQVLLSLPNLPAGHEGRLREIRDLQVIVEGKSEYFDDSGRYTPVRLYTETIILASEDKPLLIPSSNPLLAQRYRIELAVGFDLRLPGWLPPSHVTSLTNTEYGVVVKSSIGWTAAAQSVYASPSIGGRNIVTRSLGKPTAALAQLANLVEKNTSPYHPFTVKRHRLPSAMNSRAVDLTERNFSLKPAANSSSPVECVVSVPEWVDCFGKERDLKVNIRVRARRGAIEEAVKKQLDSRSPTSEAASTSSPAPDAGRSTTPEGWPSDHPQFQGDMSGDATSNSRSTTPQGCPMQRENDTAAAAESEILTHILELAMEVEEVETYCSTPTPSFTSVFPIPDTDQQPDRHSSHNAFISPRSPRADAECKVSDDVFRGYRSRKCLLAEDGTQRNFCFEKEGLAMGERWRKVNVVLPMPQGGKGSKFRPQSEMDGPMVRIKHALKIKVVCRNVGSSEDTTVVLSVPIRFATSPTTEEVVQGDTCTLRKPTLPAYIQMFHENGEQRQCDPLPMYTPSTASTPPPSYYPVAEAMVPSSPLPCLSRSATPTVGPSHMTRPSTSSSSGSSSGSSSSDDESSDFEPPMSDDGHGSIGSNHTTTSTPSSLFPPALPTYAITKLPPVPVAAA